MDSTARKSARSAYPSRGHSPPAFLGGECNSEFRRAPTLFATAHVERYFKRSMHRSYTRAAAVTSNAVVTAHRSDREGGATRTIEHSSGRRATAPASARKSATHVHRRPPCRALRTAAPSRVEERSMQRSNEQRVYAPQAVAEHVGQHVNRRPASRRDMPSLEGAEGVHPVGENSTPL